MVGLIRILVVSLLLLAGGVDAAKNNPPTVNLTAPANGATFTAPATVNLAATASDSDGTVAKVEFLNGTTVIATVTTAPYAYAWPNVAIGSYSLTARATDNLGATKTSAAAAITVTGPPLTIQSPTEGAVVTTNVVDITGTFQGTVDSTILVDNGHGSNILATVNGSTFTASSVPLFLGPNALKVTVIRRDGTSGSTTVHVTLRAYPPYVVITSPDIHTTYQTPVNLTLQALVDEPYGSVTRVDYYNGSPGTFLGTANTPPYTVVWNNVPPGTYGIVAHAVESSGAYGTGSVTVSVVGANIPPTVSLTSPANGASFTAPASITVQAAASDADGTISTVKFFEGANTIGITNTTPYQILWSNVPAGSYSLTASATDNRSATTTSSPVSVTVVTPNQPPTVTLTAPVSGASYFAPATVNLSATAADSDGSISRVDFYNGASLIGSSTSPPYAAVWSNVAAGSYAITAQATDNAGAVATSAPASVTVSGPGIAVTSPGPGASIGDNNVLVTGTVVGPVNSGITINGQPASYDRNGHFFAVVPLVAGANVLQVNLATETGQTATQSLSLTSSSVRPGSFSADTTYGFAPLPVSFTVQVQNGLQYNTAEFDFDGSGAFATVFQASALSYPTFGVTITFSQQGVYPVAVRLRDINGVIVYQASQVIQVVTSALLDGIARGVWTQMNNSLVANNLGQAKAFLTDSANGNYGDAFNALAGRFAQIVPTYSAPQTMADDLDRVSLTVHRTVLGVDYVYVIQFVLDHDGVWRLDSM